MRTQTLVTALALAGATTACNWTEFDDLEDATWVRSTQDPGVGAADYGVAIVGVTTATSGGQLAVLSADSPNFSTIDYSGAGDADVGPNPIKLGDEKIASLSDSPVFVTDGAGKIALIERSLNGGNYALLYGPATAPTGLEFAAAANPATPPDTGAYLPDGTFVFTAGSTLYTVAAAGGTPAVCAMVDDLAAPLELAALAPVSTYVVGWTKAGKLVQWQQSDLAACPGTPLPAAIPYAFSGSLMPAPGAQIHIDGARAILTAHAAGSRTGAAYVVDLGSGAQVGSTLTLDGVKSSALATFGTTTYLAVGIPDAAGPDSKVTGEVDLFAYDTTAGSLDASVATVLYDNQPEDNQQFGRSVAALTFNGATILSVAADSEVFTYYRTALYDNLP
jgi:hypothetical protein